MDVMSLINHKFVFLLRIFVQKKQVSIEEENSKLSSKQFPKLIYSKSRSL